MDSKILESDEIPRTFKVGWRRNIDVKQFVYTCFSRVLETFDATNPLELVAVNAYAWVGSSRNDPRITASFTYTFAMPPQLQMTHLNFKCIPERMLLMPMPYRYIGMCTHIDITDAHFFSFTGSRVTQQVFCTGRKHTTDSCIMPKSFSHMGAFLPNHNDHGLCIGITNGRGSNELDENCLVENVYECFHTLFDTSYNLDYAVYTFFSPSFRVLLQDFKLKFRSKLFGEMQKKVKGSDPNLTLFFIESIGAYPGQGQYDTWMDYMSLLEALCERPDYWSTVDPSRLGGNHNWSYEHTFLYGIKYDSAAFYASGKYSQLMENFGKTLKIH